MAELDLFPKPKLDLLSDPASRAIATEAEAEQAAVFAVGIPLPGDTDPAFQETKKSVRNTGTAEAIKAALAERSEQKQADAVIQSDQVLLDPSTTPEVKINQLKAISDEPKDSSLREVFLKKTAEIAARDSANEEDIYNGTVNYLTLYAELPAIANQIAAEETTYDPDNAIRDVTESVALPGYAVQMYEVLNEAIPGFARPGDAVFPGSMVERFKEQFLQMSPDEQIDVIRKIARAAEANKFFGRDNGAIKRDVIVSLLGDFKPSSAEKIILNAISILDLLALGEAVRIGSAAVRTGAKAAQLARKGELSQSIINNFLERKKAWSPSSQLDRTDPKKSKEVAEQVLNDLIPAPSVNETKVSLTGAHVLPDPITVNPTAAPSLHEPANEILGYDGRAILFDRTELKNTVDRASIRTREILQVAPTVHLNKMQIAPIEGGGGVISTTVIGLPEGGWSTAAKAQAQAVKLEGEFPVEVIVRDGRTNELRPITEVPKEHQIPEYFIRYQEEVRYSTEDSVARNPIVGGLTGRLAKFFTKSSWLDDVTSIGGSAAGDLKAARNRVLSDMLDPLFKLSTSKRRIVEDLIDRGDQIGKFFNDVDLELEWGWRPDYAELVNAYQHFQRFQQTQWKLVNDGIRERLDALGMKEILFKPNGKEEFLAIGKPALTVPSNLRRVYDPDLDEIVDVDAITVSQYNKFNKVLGDKAVRGFVELRSPIAKGTEDTLYALVTDSLAIRRLPDEVIKNVPGRLPRIYQVTHLVKRRVESFRNGAEVVSGIPVKMAKNNGEAHAAKNELQAADPDNIYDVVPANELREDAEYANRTSLEYFEDSGQLWTSRRGFELDSVDGTRMVAPVLDRISIAREHAARINTLDLFVEKQIKNWELEFGKDFGVHGKMPPMHQELPRNDPRTTDPTEGVSSERRYRDAIAMREHIAMVSGANDGLMQRNIRNLAVLTADKLATSKVHSDFDKARNWSASKILEHRNTNPVNFLKQAAFIKFIVANPGRQILLQAQQSSVYLAEPGALKYFASGAGIRDWNGMVIGLLSRDHPAQWKAISEFTSKRMGMSVEEYTEFVDSIRKSGLLANIDSHAFNAGMLTDRTFGGGKGFIDNFFSDKTVQTGRRELQFGVDKGLDAFNGLVRGAKVVRKLGFDAGEAMQLITAFLVKRNRWMIENPKRAHLWNKGRNLVEISGSARQISFEMTREGALGFQKGLAGLVFQFASHNTKALQALLPNTRFLGIGKLSNKAFTNKQKALIAAHQLGVYGVGGFGLYEAWDNTKAQIGEVPEAIDLLVKEGLFGTLATALIRGTTDEPFDVDISGSIAPFSGVLKGTPLNRIFADSTIIGNWDIRNIPVWAVGKDVADTLDMLAFLTGKELPEDLEISPTEREFLKIDAIMRNFPVWNNLMKARSELAINRIITNSGDATVKAAGAEILAGAMFGLKTAQQRQLYSLRESLTGRRGKEITGPIDEDLREHAQLIYNNVMKVLQRSGDRVATLQEVNRYVREIALVDRELMDEFEYRRVHQQLIPSIIMSDLKKGDEESVLVDTLFGKLQAGQIRTTDSIIDEVANSALLRDPDKETIVRMLRDIGE